MQLLFDFFPVIAFFGTYQLTGDLFTATAVIIVAVIAQTAWQWFRHRKVSQMALVSGVLVLIFGGLTLLIHDKAFIQWKVTVVNWLFAAAFLASRFFGDKLIIERMMGQNLQLERSLWQTLNWAWIVFFIALGALNLYVAYNFSEAFWVKFKLFGMLGLTVAFAIGQTLWLSSKMPAEDASAESGKSQ
ncbi:MAG TPA: septation protein A [Steroidobacter sp.]|uniref:septation protein A n=1 Tax=Steroidobacter sp. TaxID=1978227 RepID=UPI002ED9921C